METTGDRLDAETLRDLQARIEEDRDRLRTLLERTTDPAVVELWKEDARRDLADAGAAVTGRDHEVAVRGSTARRLALIESALDRVRAGTYGRCVVCGEGIPLERLDALPHAPTCLRDRAVWERRGAAGSATAV